MEWRLRTFVDAAHVRFPKHGVIHKEVIEIHAHVTHLSFSVDERLDEVSSSHSRGGYGTYFVRGVGKFEVVVGHRVTAYEWGSCLRLSRQAGGGAYRSERRKKACLASSSLLFLLPPLCNTSKLFSDGGGAR